MNFKKWLVEYGYDDYDDDHHEEPKTFKQAAARDAIKYGGNALDAAASGMGSLFSARMGNAMPQGGRGYGQNTLQKMQNAMIGRKNIPIRIVVNIPIENAEQAMKFQQEVFKDKTPNKESFLENKTFIKAYNEALRQVRQNNYALNKKEPIQHEADTYYNDQKTPITTHDGKPAINFVFYFDK